MPPNMGAKAAQSGAASSNETQDLAHHTRHTAHTAHAAGWVAHLVISHKSDSWVMSSSGWSMLRTPSPPKTNTRSPPSLAQAACRYLRNADRTRQHAAIGMAAEAGAGRGARASPGTQTQRTTLVVVHELVS